MIYPEEAQSVRTDVFLKVVVYKSWSLDFHNLSLHLAVSRLLSSAGIVTFFSQHSCTAQTQLKSSQWSRSCTGFVSRWSTEAPTPRRARPAKSVRMIISALSAAVRCSQSFSISAARSEIFSVHCCDIYSPQRMHPGHPGDDVALCVLLYETST